MKRSTRFVLILTFEVPFVAREILSTKCTSTKYPLGVLFCRLKFFDNLTVDDRHEGDQPVSVGASSDHFVAHHHSVYDPSSFQD